MPRNHPYYEQGYSDGYNTGYNRALESQIDAAQRSSQPAITLTAPTEVVNAARSTLAQKVLETVEAEEESRFGKGAHGISAALRELFQREGIEIASSQPAPVADGRYCRHHDDDPAHGAICYDGALYGEEK